MATVDELREQVLSVARGWLGCKESDGSHKKIIDVYNSHKPLAQGYKVKYTDAWCMTFASACFIKAGLSDLIKTECSCSRALALYKNAGMWIEDDSVVPEIGWLLLYDWQDDGNGDNVGAPDHVGIVEKVENGVITVIEGNKNDAVERREVKVNGKYIRGFCKIDFSKMATTPISTATTGILTDTLTVGSATKSSDEEIIWDYLYTKIQNANGVSAIMGNLYAESALYANNLQNTYNTKLKMTDVEYTKAVDNGTYTKFGTDKAGYGLAQWTTTLRKTSLLTFAKQKNSSVGDVTTQLEFMYQELESMYPQVLKRMKKALVLKNASDFFLINYEKPSNITTTMKNKRYSYSKTYYSRYKNRKNSSISVSLVVGDKVKVLNNTTYDGKSFKLYYDTYDVISVNKDKIVIGIGKTVTAAINIANLEKV